MSAQVGLDALLDFNLHFALPSGEKLTQQEIKQLLSTSKSINSDQRSMGTS